MIQQNRHVVTVLAVTVAVALLVQPIGLGAAAGSAHPTPLGDGVEPSPGGEAAPASTAEPAASNASPPSSGWERIVDDGDEADVVVDLQTVWMNADDEHIYFKVRTHEPWTVKSEEVDTAIFLDTDRDRATGLNNDSADTWYYMDDIGADYAVVVGLEGNNVWRWDAEAETWDQDYRELSYLDFENDTDTFVVGIDRDHIGDPSKIDVLTSNVDVGEPTPWDWAPDRGDGHLTVTPDAGQSEQSGPPLGLSVENATATPNGTATVDFTVTNNNDTTMNGVALEVESMPDNWTVASQSSDANAWNNESREWLWLTLSAGASTSASLTLSVPNDTAPGDYSVTARATEGNNPVTRTATVTVTSGQPVDEAIAGSNGVVSTTEILQAINYWASGDPVPGTDGATIDTATLLGLIDHWATGQPV